jgi:hypothetical protein
MDGSSRYRPWRSRIIVVVTLSISLMGLSGPPARADVFKGSFSVFCGPSHRNRSDPIVYPRQPGKSHLHQFFGNRSTNAFSTYKRMLNARTTCGFRPDTAGYWAPALKNRSGKVVRPFHLSAYYRGDRNTQAFPPGLKMLAGGSTSNLRRAGWTCGEGDPDFHQPPDCGNRRLRAVVIFPSCWDGKRKDSPNHRGHMSYREAGGCPAHHPVEVPKLILFAKYRVGNGNGFRLSSDPKGHPGGTTLHADFWNTWHQLALRRAVRGCINQERSCKLGR